MRLTTQHKADAWCVFWAQAKEAGRGQKAGQNGGFLPDVREIDTPHGQQRPRKVFQNLAFTPVNILNVAGVPGKVFPNGRGGY